MRDGGEEDQAALRSGAWMIRSALTCLVSVLTVGVILIQAFDVHVYMCASCYRTWAASWSDMCECGSRHVRRVTPQRVVSNKAGLLS